MTKQPSATAAISFESPVGWVTVEAAPFKGGDKIIYLTMSATKGHEFGSSAVLREAKKQLQAYFAGKLTKFDLPVELAGTDFQKAVWRQIAKIPFGKTVSYADIAGKIGKPLASRAVGGAVGSNPVALIVGCHRVMGASGRITGYSGGDGIPTKRWLLAHESIESAD
ncbi:MAG: methylated-DNA--[protein]-cysteine S-methyltransferase [Micrococcales bacterium]